MGAETKEYAGFKFGKQIDEESEEIADTEADQAKEAKVLPKIFVESYDAAM